MPAQYIVGQAVGNGQTVASDTFVTLADGTTIETMIDTANNKTVIDIYPSTNPVTIQQTILNRASAALAANATYQAIASPTTAQAVAQVALLTREVNGIIRLLLAQFDTTTGT